MRGSKHLVYLSPSFRIEETILRIHLNTWKNAAAFASLNIPVYYEGTRVIQEEGWEQVINPTLNDPSTNEVRLSLIKPELIPSKIEETFALYRSHKLDFRWATGPMSTPGIEEMIAPLASTSWDYVGMAMETSKKAFGEAEISIERVDEDNLSQYLRINLEGWELNEYSEAAKVRFTKMARHPSYRCFLAKKNNVYVGTAATILREGFGYLIGAVVIKEHRGAGAYKRLIDARMNDLYEIKLPFAVTQARTKTSAPILSKLGFEEVFQGKIYKFIT